MIPDIEKITIQYLKGEGINAVGATPKDTGLEWVKVQQVGTRQVSAIDQDYFNAHHLQLDCYASADGPEFTGEVNTLYRNVRADLVLMPDATLSCVVTAVRFSSGIRLPDTDFNPHRQRYVLDAFIYAHA